MRKLFDEYFRAPKGGKIREKVMLARIATTVTIVVLCLAAMGFTAYAYFSVDLTYGSNTITAANFDIEVTVQPREGDPVAVTREGNTLAAQLEAGEYTVTLKQAETSTARTGFAIVSFENCDDVYYTTQINRAGELAFTLTVEESTGVSFLAHWGTSSYYDKYKEIGGDFFIDEGKTIVLERDAEQPIILLPDDDAEDTEDEEPSSEPVADEDVSPAPEPAEPVPDEPAESDEPEATEPAEPEASEPEPVASEPAEPEPTEPAEPEPTEPTEPEPAEPVEPAEGSEPETTEPAEDPEVPAITEPGKTVEPEPSTEEPGEIDAVDEPGEPDEPNEEPVEPSVEEPIEDPAEPSVEGSADGQVD